MKLENAIRALAGTLLLASCGRHEAATHEPTALPTAAVRVQVARLQPHTAAEEVVGTVRSKLRAMVEAKISGRLLEYTAIPGTKVKKSDLLARLENQEIQAKVDQARAMLEQAQSDFSRQKQLIESKATTRQDFDAAEARVKVTAASVSEAETLAGYARVTAPFDGVITRKLADVGDLAMPGKPLLEIEAPTALRFEADLPEAMLDRMSLGARMQVRIAALPQPLEAVVSEIAPVADPVSRTFLVKLDLPAADGLRTGQFGRVAVPVAETKLLLVPAASVIRRGQMELLFVVKEGHALLRLVKTGKVLSDGIEILSGLEEGERVVINDAAKLIDGQPVTIQP
jgi:membrane fusion protein, multidrug efflux system